MGWIHWMGRRLHWDVGLPEMAEEIADRSYEAVWQRVRGQIMGLTPAEARGYIRARGAVLLRPRFLQLADQYGIIAVRRPKLYALASDALVRRVQSHGRAVVAAKMIRRAA